MTAEGRLPGLASGIRSGYLNLAVSWLVQALLVPLLLGHLGRDAFGLYATLTSIVGYLALLTFGSALTVPRYVADHAARGEAAALSAFASTYFVLHVGVALAGVLAGWAFTPLLASHLNVPASLAGAIAPAWRLVVASWALGLAGGLFQSFLTGMGDVSLANVTNSARAILTLAVAASILLAGGGLAALLEGLLVVSLAGSVLAFALLRARHPEIHVSPRLARRATLRATARPAALFFLMQIAALVVTGTDNVIISVFLGVGAVAAYSVAFQLWSLALAVLWSGVDPLMPFFTRWHATGDRAALTLGYLRATKAAFAGTVLAAIVVAAFGVNLIRWWIGPTLTADPRVLWVFSALFLIATPIHTAALVLAAIGRHRSPAIGGLIEAVLNLALSLALVRPLGVVGVALGTLLAGASANAWIAPRAACRELGIGVPEYVRRALAPALLPAAAAGTLALILVRAVPSDSPLRLVALVSVAGLFTLLFWYGGLDEAERRQALALIYR